jgi:hypothetical protein
MGAPALLCCSSFRPPTRASVMARTVGLMAAAPGKRALRFSVWRPTSSGIYGPRTPQTEPPMRCTVQGGAALRPYQGQQPWSQPGIWMLRQRSQRGPGQVLP